MRGCLVPVPKVESLVKETVRALLFSVVEPEPDFIAGAGAGSCNRSQSRSRSRLDRLHSTGYYEGYDESSLVRNPNITK